MDVDGSHARPWRRVVVTGVIVVAVGLGVTAAANTQRAPASPPKPAAVLKPSPAASPAPDPDAARVLRSAALAAGQLPDPTLPPDGYVFLEWIYQPTPSVGIDPETGKPDPPRVPELNQYWLSVDGTREGYWRSHPLADPHAWSGAPVTVADEPAVSPDYLPTDTDAMVTYLYHSGVLTFPDWGAFSRGIELFDRQYARYARPPVLSAVFSAMARIPGLTVEPDVVDAAGRHGISVGNLFLNGIRTELIFDPQTYACLGERDISVDDRGGLPPGVVLSSTAYLRTGIVDRIGELP